MLKLLLPKPNLRCFRGVVLNPFKGRGCLGDDIAGRDSAPSFRFPFRILMLLIRLKNEVFDLIVSSVFCAFVSFFVAFFTDFACLTVAFIVGVSFSLIFFAAVIFIAMLLLLLFLLLMALALMLAVLA